MPDSTLSDPTIAALPLCLVYSDDGVLCRQLTGLLRDRAYLLVAAAPLKLRSLLAGSDPVLLFLDLRQPASRDLVSELAGPARSRIVTVALGTPGSVPFTAAEDAHLYRVEDIALTIDLRAFRSITESALDRVNYMQENQMLRLELARVNTQVSMPSSDPSLGRPPLGFQQLIKPARHHEGLEPLFEKIIDGVASSVMVTRVGLFYSPREGQPYRLKAGLSQRKLAAMLGRSKDAVSSWERGLSAPWRSILEPQCARLGAASSTTSTRAELADA